MNRGFYNAASAMMLQQKRLNTVSNNLANLQTAGYKSEQLTTRSFEEVISRLDEDGIYYDYTDIGVNTPLRIVDSVEQYYTQGDIRETERPFDVAIAGDGYFNISDGENTYYTRNGSFNLDNDGYLNLEGYGRVQGLGGDIYLGTSDFLIDESGNIIDYEGNEIDTLQISMCENIMDLRKQTNGLYAYEGEAQMYDITTTIQQNALESSTVNLNTEMTRVMEINRQFGAMSTILQTIDSINEKAVTEIGKL